MIDKQINAAIAKACGRRQKANGEWFPDNGLTVGSQGIPDYCNDLNAMHEAEKIIEEEQLVGLYNEWLLMDSSCEPILATARQRAEAFLQTLDKWEEVQE